MIAYLSGTLHHLEPNRAIVLCAGVGYDVRISLSTYYKLEGKSEATLEIYTHVREDTLALYGFATDDEKLAFEKLISISGIGPTLAQKILSGIDAPDLAEAVSRGDARKLSSIPGVGKKTAERICLELRDKLVVRGERGAPPPVTRSTVESDVESALVNLGYKQSLAVSAIEVARKQIGAEGDFSSLLKTALRQLTK